jgi:hypothetical protein
MIVKNIKEDDGTDPLTLMNLILAKDAKNMGYDWDSKADNNKSEEDVFTDALARQGVQDYERDEEPIMVTQATEDVQQDQQAQQQQQVPMEQNNKDPNVMSTDPMFNPCPAFLQGICRVDGRPCAYSAMDYKECGKYFLASSGDPQLFEVPPGREQSQEYIQGIKS